MASGFKSTFIDIDGHVHVADYGGRGKPIVLVHGLGGCHLNWMAAAPLLTDRYRVLALDLLGFGRTPLHGRCASVEANQRLIDRFLCEHLGERAILVGNSMGGLISLLQADANPDSIEAVALVNAAMPHPSTWSIDPHVLALFTAMTLPGVGEVFMWLGNEMRSAERKVREMFVMCAADATRIAQEVVRAHIELIEEHAAQGWGNRAYLQATRSLVRLLLHRERYHAIVRRIRIPALVIAGAHDRLIRLNAAEHIAKLRPDWRFVPLAHVGHVPQMEDPEGFTQILAEWIDTLGNPAPGVQPPTAAEAAAHLAAHA